MRKTVLFLGLLTMGVFTSCAKREPLVIVSTDFGEIVILLFNETPQHKKNFLELAKGGFYDGTSFHRVIDNFMIQGGDPNSKDNDKTNDGRGSPGYKVPAEFVDDLTHVQGAVAAARQADRVNPEKESNGSQFYIIEPEQGYHFLDGEYTVFGQVISGIEVVQTIAEQPKDPRTNRPLDDIKMTMVVKTMSKKKISKLYGYEFPAQD